VPHGRWPPPRLPSDDASVAFDTAGDIRSAAPVTPSGEVGRFARTLGGLYLRLSGWRVEGRFPDVARAVVIAAPHTSNWDLPLMLAVAYVLGIRPAWLGKRELFRWPFGWFMRWLGGLPVDRGARGNLVQQAVDRFAAVERLHLVVPPSGTRSRATHWKSGFYHIARGARVPIVCTFLDYRRRVGGIGPLLAASGDVVADMRRIREFYADIAGKFPASTTPVRLVEEDEPGRQSG
jgi:1-acyl-sn-glycerol-3-phosphate acyltransferase